MENKPEIFNYANDNIEQLALDMANGDGNTLDALAELMEIPALDRDVWKKALQRDFSIIFPAPYVATAFVLDQIASTTGRENIRSPKTRNLSWNDIFFGRY